MTELLWQALWRNIEDYSLKLAGDGLWSAAAIRRCVRTLPDLYGWDWVEKAVTEGHPLTAYLPVWPAVRYATQFVDLISFVKERGTPEGIVHQLIERTRPSSISAFWSVFEELRVLWCLNRVGVDTFKLAEYQPTGKKGTKGKAQDLRCSLRGTDLYVEVTQLLSTDNMLRANAAWDRVTRLHMMRTMGGLSGSLWLDCRPYSPRHVDVLEHEMNATIDEAERNGLGVLNKPGLMKYVVWRAGHEQQADVVLGDLDLEPGSVSMPWTWHSTVSPFRVVQKITDKNRQASRDPWLLVIKASDVLETADVAQAMVSEASEWLYDQPNLVGVMLYCHWDTWGVATGPDLTLDTDQIVVRTTEFQPNQKQQTVLLRNRFTTFPETDYVYAKLLEAGMKTGWVPVFDN